MTTNLKNLANEIMSDLVNKEFIGENNISYITHVFEPATDIAVDEANQLFVSAKINDKKVKFGNASINFKIEVKDNDKPMSVTMYISEKKFGDVITFVNDISHDLVVASSGKTAMENATKHISKYLENSVKSMFGLKKEFSKNEK